MNSKIYSGKSRPKQKDSTRWWIVGVAAVLIGLGLIIAISWIPVGDPPIGTEKTLGSINAPIIVEEYADFQCPFCGKFSRGTLKQIVDKYVKTGQVQIVFRHYAVLGEESIRAAEAAECASRQDKFWAYYDTLYANQAGENTGAFSDHNLVRFAQALNLDMTAFNTCFTRGQRREMIQLETTLGQQRGVEGVPTLFINGKKVVGAISLPQFETAIGPLLTQ